MPDWQPPEQIIPPTLSEAQLSQSVQNFARGIWFAPGDLRPQNLHQRLRLLYLPLWLVDSDVQAQWQAEVGFDYQVVSHKEKYANNQWQTYEVKESRIRWEPRVGQLQRRYHNIAAPALDEHKTVQAQLGRYDLQKGEAYREDAAANALIRLPNRPPQDAWPDAEPAFLQQAGQECQTACQANHIRDYRWSSRYTNQNWTQLLQPVYVSHYFDDEQKPHPVLINGQTGQVFGRRRASNKKARWFAIIIAILAFFIVGLGIAAAIFSFFLESSLLSIGGVLILAGSLFGSCALIPLFIAWQFNRTEKKRDNKPH